MAKIQSVEPNIADLANGWLKSYKRDYKLEQESLNTEIDQALNDYYSKNGGVGGNRPDAKLLLQDKNLVNYPILIEYKGYKDKLVKLDADGKVANKTAKNQPDFRNINSYAVNGAVHYANALLVRQIIPYNRMLISSDGYLIPLDDRYFRIDAQNLGFKYGGEITCVGMITNIIGEDTDPNDSQNIFATLQFSVNEVLRQLLPTKERNLCVIHPIAVYYGN